MNTTGIEQCILNAKQNGFVWADTALAELENLTKKEFSFEEKVVPNCVTWGIK